MRLSAIDTKLLRELRRLKGQVLTIAIVLAGGLTCFIALRGTYDSLEEACATYYDQSRFGHVFVQLERAPETLARRLEALPSVTVLETRIEKEVSLPIEGLSRPAYGRLLSLPADREPATNVLHLESGRLPGRGRQDEVAVLASFAAAHGLAPGDSLPAVMNGKLRKLRVTGIVLSPEFVYAIRPGALVHDPRHYAALWMERSAFASAFQLEGAFNGVSLRIAAPEAERAVLAALDRILAPYGGNGAIPRKDQLSNRAVEQELSQLRGLAGMVPAVFLGVAAFLVNLVLGRLIRLERAEIATLKAVGYSNAEVARHYLGLVAVVLLPGSVLGVLGGELLGLRVFGLYAELFRFPALRFTVSGALIATGVLVCAAVTTVGAVLAVRSALRLTPAEAMRPPAPARYRRGLADRLQLGRLVGGAGLMVVRELERRPLRTLSSSLGIAGAIALIVLGHFGVDTLEAFLLGTFQREQRQDLTVTFARPVAVRAVAELARLPGVVHAEGVRVVPARARGAARQRDVAVLGLPAQAVLRQVIARGGEVIDVPGDGVLLSRALASVLGLEVGDRLDIELREGRRKQVRPVVVALVDDTTGLNVYARAELVAALEHDLGVVSQVLLTVDPERRPGVEARLRRYPQVIDVSDLRGDVQRLRDMNGSVMDVWTLVSITLSACIIFGVVYNNARISLEARSRELGSLRVLGFSRREISSVLIGSLAVEVALAIPLGLVLGRLWGKWFMESSLNPETLRWVVVVEPRTYLLATVVVVLAGAASALWVRRSLDHLDLIAVLKTRE